jgi:predicted nuclease of predicted toxin-antitoxin system
MKFLVDAQLPKNLSEAIKLKGFDCLHTLDLPEGNKTTDKNIIAISETENRIIITKDNDFYESYILYGSPKKILFISTGNIKNSHLKELLEKHFTEIIMLFDNNSVLELTADAIIIHY